MEASGLRRVRWDTVVWTVIIGLTFVSVTLGLMNVPDAAIQFGYLYASSLLMAAYRFGLRGALLGSAISLLCVLGFYQAAQTNAVDSTALLRDLGQLAASTSSPEELRSLAGQLTDLRSSDAYTNFLRATSGLILLIVSSIVVGLLFDRTREQEAENRRAAHQLRRFFAPKLVDAIMAGQAVTGLTSHRKELAVLFADPRGFTSLSERLEPEELSGLLNEYLSEMTAVLERPGGTLDKYLGDGILAFFGDPVAYPDAELKALKTAIDTRDRFDTLRDRWFQEGREAVQLGIGVHSGFMTVGTFGSDKLMSYTVIGSNANLTARLSNQAEPGQILTSQRTYFKARHFVEGRPVGEMTVKGRSQPIEVVEVVGNRFIPIARPQESATEDVWDAVIGRRGAVPRRLTHRAIGRSEPRSQDHRSGRGRDRRARPERARDPRRHPGSGRVPRGLRAGRQRHRWGQPARRQPSRGARDRCRVPARPAGRLSGAAGQPRRCARLRPPAADRLTRIRPRSGLFWVRDGPIGAARHVPARVSRC